MDPTRVPVTVSMKIKKNEKKEEESAANNTSMKIKKNENKEEEPAANKRPKKLVHQVIIYINIPNILSILCILEL